MLSERCLPETSKCNMTGMEETTGIDAKATIYKNNLGLLSADELAFAGYSSIAGGKSIVYLDYNAKEILFWYTMSPSAFTDSSGDDYSTIYMAQGGYISGEQLAGSGGVRPVIALKYDATLKKGLDYIQDGTIDRPYVIS